MAISTAIGSERKSRVSGIKLKKGFFSEETSNLPIMIAVFGEANTANQAGLSVTKKEVTSAKEAGELYGYGSPIHQQMRILRPKSGDGIGGIPTVVFPQISDAGASATSKEWTITGTSTASATHTIVVNGRRSLDYQTYAYTVILGDSPTTIAGKIKDAVNGVLSSPITAVNTAGVLTFTTKWKGETSKELNISFDNNDIDAGITYAQTSSTDGAGTVSLANSFSQFGDDWYQFATNPYGSDATLLAAFESFNGHPDDDTPTGRYEPRLMKPFVALFGSTGDDKDDLVTITNATARIEENTNVLCPAPKSSGFTSEAVANALVVYARIAQDSPELDLNGKSYPDMPVPDDGLIGDMSDYNNRDYLVKKGCSTVILENGAYQVQDFVTTYHPDGEDPLQYAYIRNLILDFNIIYSYRLLEDIHVKDHVLVLDGQITDVSKSIKPKQWKAVLYDMIDNLAVRALIKDAEDSKSSIQVDINSTNPDRFDTFFRYSRTGIARIESTDVEAGF